MVKVAAAASIFVVAFILVPQEVLRAQHLDRLFYFLPLPCRVLGRVVLVVVSVLVQTPLHHYAVLRAAQLGLLAFQ